MDENKLLSLAVKAGAIMLENGAETYRVEDTASRILSVVETSNPEIIATTTGLFAGIESKKGSISKIKRIKSRTINLEKITLVNELSRQFVSGKISLDEALNKLEKINSLSEYYLFMYCLFNGIGCFAFTLMLKSTPADAACSLIIGMILGLITRKLEERNVQTFLVSLVGGVVIAFLSYLISSVFNNLSQSHIISGSLMPLLPGVAITNAVRDLMNGDYLSGTSRTTEAAIVCVALACGIGITLLFLSEVLGGIL